jgi:hypothetical protein
MNGLRDIGISLTLVFDDNRPRHEKNLYLPSTKLEDSFHVNKKIFEISMKQVSSIEMECLHRRQGDTRKRHHLFFKRLSLIRRLGSDTN